MKTIIDGLIIEYNPNTKRITQMSDWTQAWRLAATGKIKEIRNDPWEPFEYFIKEEKC